MKIACEFCHIYKCLYIKWRAFNVFFLLLLLLLQMMHYTWHVRGVPRHIDAFATVIQFPFRFCCSLMYSYTYNTHTFPHSHTFCLIHFSLSNAFALLLFLIVSIALISSLCLKCVIFFFVFSGNRFIVFTHFLQSNEYLRKNNNNNNKLSIVNFQDKKYIV